MANASSMWIFAGIGAVFLALVLLYTMSSGTQQVLEIEKEEKQLDREMNSVQIGSVGATQSKSVGDSVIMEKKPTPTAAMPQPLPPVNKPGRAQDREDRYVSNSK